MTSIYIHLITPWLIFFFSLEQSSSAFSTQRLTHKSFKIPLTATNQNKMCQATRIYINHTVCGHRSKNPVLRVGPPCPISLAAGVGEVYCPLPELKWQDKEAESPEPCSICHDTKLWYLIINQDGVRKKWVPLISATDAVMHNKTSLNGKSQKSLRDSIGNLWNFR